MRFMCEIPPNDIKCKHPSKDFQYGYFSGCPGIGVGWFCVDCYETLSYRLDHESCLDSEIEKYNQSKWNKG